MVTGTTSDGAVLPLLVPGGSNLSSVNSNSCKYNGSGSTLNNLNTTCEEAYIFTVGASAAKQLQTPLWYAAKYGSDDITNWDVVNNATSAVGSDGIPDNYFKVSNPAALNASLSKVFNSIVQKESAAAALASNSTQITATSILYQAKFDPKDWSGSFLAYPVDSNGQAGADGTQYWDAGLKLPPTANPSRTIRTYSGSSPGLDFTTGALTGLPAAQQTSLCGTTTCAGTAAGQNLINWLRGSAAQEHQNGGVLRDRKKTVLGDIVNSDPAFFGQDDYGYAAISGEGGSYASYVTGKSGKQPIVAVGANDSMLHAFLATSTGGNELFAYVPYGVYGNLAALADQAYTHKFYVDGAPTAGDAYFGGGWKTVLTGGLNAGGAQVYALDITNVDGNTIPAPLSQVKVLWEFPAILNLDGNPANDELDMGLSYSQPQIARLHNGDWAAIFGNGYNSAAGKAVLYVVRLSDGALLKKITADTSGSNGLSTPVLRTDAGGTDDKIVDYVYAGDLKGNMWKFDLTGSTPASWGVAYSGQPLFTAINAGSQIEPITSPPRLGKHPNGGKMVYFGTGRYLGAADKTNTTTQSFYGIWDNDVSVISSRSQLQQQSVGGASDTKSSLTVFGSSNATVNYTTQRGWFMDLNAAPVGSPQERVVSAPLVIYDRVIFTSLVPSTDPCKSGGDGYLTELDALTGAAPSGSVFDFNNDQKFDSSDNASFGVVSKVQSPVGIIKTPVWMEKSNGPAFKETSGSSGAIWSLTNKPGPGPGPGPGTLRRTYWMQIL
jgi:type IV pilus assembly protein PilY1